MESTTPCKVCNVTIGSKSKFCPECGHAVDAYNEGSNHTRSAPQIQTPAPSFDTLRACNWALAGVLVAGLALQLLRAPTGSGLVMLAIMGAMLLSFPVTAAVALSQTDFSLGGMYIRIDAERRRRLRLAALVINWVVGAFGLIGAVACLLSSQIGPLLAMAPFILLPAFNIRALSLLRKIQKAEGA